MSSPKTKKEIVEDLHDRLDGQVRKHDIESVYKTLVAQILDQLKSGESYRLGDLGTFERAYSPKREGRNPQTSEAITVEASHRIRFKQGQAAKRYINH